MPGFILHAGATVRCTHQGQAAPTAVDPRVRVSGRNIVTVVPPYKISGCPHTVSSSSVPCVIGFWTSGATRVRASGQPVVILGSTSVCVLNATPMVISKLQRRVFAT